MSKGTPSMGKKSGKTSIVTIGAAYKGKAAIIEIDKEKTPKIEFIK